MLKTYIFLYTIVAICLQTLLGTLLIDCRKIKIIEIHRLKQLRPVVEIF